MTLTEFLLARIAEDEKWRWHIDYCRALDDGACDCHATERVLAECEAKRRIIVGLDYESDEWCFADAPAVAEVLPFLSLPYADHPDYRQEWKP